MGSFCKDFFENSPIRHELDEFHFFRQVNVTTSCVLLINRCDHDLVAKHQLVFDADCHLIIRINEAKRFKVHIVIQRSFHVFTVKIRHKTISGVNDAAEIFDVFELVTFLFSCSFCRMITHQRCKHTECKETEQKISGRVVTKSAKVCACVHKSTHIQRWKHLQI